MAKIQSVAARQILDSRGNPTVEATVTLESGISATASCPSGASTGAHEALELRDHDQNSYYGKGVLTAVKNVNTIIAQSLVGKNLSDIQEVDKLLISLDGTENKSALGANAILSISIACTKAIAVSEDIPIYQYIGTISGIQNEWHVPSPLSNLINGGMHAGDNLDIQEFIVTPIAPSFSEAIQNVVHVYMKLRQILVAKGFQPLVGDEGGFAPKLATNVEALALLQEAIAQTGASEVVLGIDAAATHFYKQGKYELRDKPQPLSGDELGNYYLSLAEKYNIRFLEDIFAEDDVAAWTNFLPKAPQELIVTGDDLTVTNPKRLDIALEKKMIRGIIIKPNQIGTVSEAIHVVKKAKAAGLKVIVSHRSGETTDDFIADFAVGVGADFAKFGAPVRGERVVKYNRLMQIEEELNVKNH
ncbi:MAG: phosphopyruvate hydratase [Candidatus Levybacteria bacterium]|nr:phosphopyruvate hydratase [Candidatus Levybacteria bacterium]